MVTISHTGFTSNIPLEAILRVKTKEKIVGIITKLGAYISPNLKKDETARRAAAILLDDPQLVLDDLNKDELKLVKEFVAAGPNAYITRKMRKMPYKLQKYALVLTCEDFDAQLWQMLMPDAVRLAFAPYIDGAIAFKEKYPRKLTRKERLLAEWMDLLPGEPKE